MKEIHFSGPMTQCPNCQSSIHLVQSTPTVILLCKSCGTFFDASLQAVGDLKTGLDMERVPSKPKSLENPPAVQQVLSDEQTDLEPKVEQPAKRTESMLPVLSGGVIPSSEYGCPKCGSGMKSMASPVTGNILYTCSRCGYTGTIYVKK